MRTFPTHMAGGRMFGNVVPTARIFIGMFGTIDRRYLSTIMINARAAGYTRLALPCVGSSNLARTAAATGWPADGIEMSDVGIVPVVVGTVLTGGDPAMLEARIDGDLFDPPVDDPFDWAAHFLQAFSAVRASLIRPGRGYDQAMAQFVRHTANDRIAVIADRLRRWSVDLLDASFTAEGIYEHVERVADDDKTLVMTTPPYVSAEFFFRNASTDGRVTWPEPDYLPWDSAEEGYQRLYERTCNGGCLLVVLAEQHRDQAPPTAMLYESTGPAVPEGPEERIWANRHDEVLRYAGRIQLIRRGVQGPLEPIESPLLTGPIDGPGEVTLHPLTVQQIGWAAQVTNRKRPPGTGLAVTVDGHLAGIVSYTPDQDNDTPDSKAVRLAGIVEIPNQTTTLRGLLDRIGRTSAAATAAMSLNGNPVHHIDGEPADPTDPQTISDSWRAEQ